MGDVPPIHLPSCAPSSAGDESLDESHRVPTKIPTHRRRLQIATHSSHVPSCPATPRVSSQWTREPHLQSSETSSCLLHSRQSPPANTILRPHYTQTAVNAIYLQVHPTLLVQITHHPLLEFLCPLDFQSRYHTGENLWHFDSAAPQAVRPSRRC